MMHDCVCELERKRERVRGWMDGWVDETDRLGRMEVLSSVHKS